MGMHFNFIPSAKRARDLDLAMHLGLASSLRHICERTRGILDFDEDGIERLVKSLENGDRYEAVTFSYYYELVPALLGGDFTTASSMFAALLKARPLEPGLRIVALGAGDLGEKSARYQRLMNADPSLSIGFLPPALEVEESFRDRLQRGLRLLRAAVPDLAGEIEGIINEIVIVAGDKTKKFQFDGGSHFQLWGALFLNAEFHKTDYAIVEVLAHESAHSLLFGFCTEEPLILNSDDELFASPLRPDLRPMDGIYHATFVSARMHWAMSRLLETELIDEATKEQVRDAIDADARNFEAGYGVVSEYAQLTPTGRALMDSAFRYMEAAR